jgi:PIN domain nuclease of toxin-antitoxin system
MKLLLDAHSLLWYSAGDTRLSAAAKNKWSHAVLNQ